eukprot:CAMPEP_0196785532 /NCGR_PEP_ID=MMETSP1104-20130614/19537_1 /TAXON_ID=33652 /ORGANISM="Cafeteria sp., Strain Caron Lab Isolate" /LENGTH=113 /DNA_ID=CAMNT_0042155835 /DNA_START=41 /DNA_END=379 /DNA_ORIENTATION=+
MSATISTGTSREGSRRAAPLRMASSILTTASSTNACLSSFLNASVVSAMYKHPGAATEMDDMAGIRLSSKDQSAKSTRGVAERYEEQPYCTQKVLGAASSLQSFSLRDPASFQ